MTTELELHWTFWNWRAGGILLALAAATQIVGSVALGRSPDPLAVGCLLGVVLLAIHIRVTGVPTHDRLE